jgi:phytoene synthase
MARKTSFYYSFLVLPADQRRAIIAVWDFCRAVDDAVDEAPPGGTLQARVALGCWRQELARCYEGGSPETSQGRSLVPYIKSFDLPRSAFDDVIDGVAMDLETTRYQRFDDLLEYCHRVASAVGLICIRIFGCQGAGAREYALNLGVALQLTNIIRDVGDDLDKGRIYLPLDDLAASGCTIADLSARRTTEPVRRLLAFECDRARQFYARALDARPNEDRGRLIAAEIMRTVYFDTLRRIERRDYDVFSPGVRAPRARQAFIALSQWLKPS